MKKAKSTPRKPSITGALFKKLGKNATLPNLNLDKAQYF